jgi:hypothetical protein
MIAIKDSCVPTVSIVLSPNNICNGSSAIFSATTTEGGSNPTYQWKKNGNNVGTSATTHTYTPANGDVVSCVLTSNAGCALLRTVNSNSITIVVKPILTPTISITASPALNNLITGSIVTFTTNYSSGGSTPFFQWYKNNVLINNQTNSTYTTTYNTSGGLMPGDFVRAKMISSDTCVTTSVASSNSLLAGFPLGIDPNGSNWKGDVVLFPNPNNGTFSITGQWPVQYLGETIKIELFNTLGQKVYSDSYNPTTSKWNTTITLSDTISNGTYQLKLSSGDMSTVKRVMINR